MSLVLHLGLWLSASLVGGGLPSDGTPSLIIDFVPIADPTYGDSLSLNFTAGQYEAYATDPTAPGFVNIQVWS